MEFIESVAFSKVARSYLNDRELSQLQTLLSVYPDKGMLIPGSGGLRKLRWMSEGKGKRGGLRIIYYWVTVKHRIHLLYLYHKNDQEDLSLKQFRQLRLLAEEQ